MRGNKTYKSNHFHIIASIVIELEVISSAASESIHIIHRARSQDIYAARGEALERHLQKESESKKALRIYNSVNFLAKVLELTETQKDEFWPVMVEFYEEYQRIQDTFKGVDKTSRDSYRYQLEQLKASMMQRLKTILSSQQMEGLQIHLPE